MKDLLIVMEALRSAQAVLFEYETDGRRTAKGTVDEMINILCDADVLSATDAIHPRVESPELVPEHGPVIWSKSPLPT
jgi:hypothetical protein